MTSKNIWRHLYTGRSATCSGTATLVSRPQSERDPNFWVTQVGRWGISSASCVFDAVFVREWGGCAIRPESEKGQASPPKSAICNPPQISTSWRYVLFDGNKKSALGLPWNICLSTPWQIPGRPLGNLVPFYPDRTTVSCNDILHGCVYFVNMIEERFLKLFIHVIQKITSLSDHCDMVGSRPCR